MRVIFTGGHEDCATTHRVECTERTFCAIRAVTRIESNAATSDLDFEALVRGERVREELASALLFLPHGVVVLHRIVVEED
jgi:hypothetical protein